MVAQSLFPVFILIVLGNLLKRFKLTNDAFLKTSDRLIYFIFFPVMLFWKIGGTSETAGIGWKYCSAALCAVFVVHLTSTVFIVAGRVSHFKAGSFSQSCYRFNTYIGVAVVMNALGEEGIRLFGILIGFLIPVINVLAVSTLIWFSSQSFSSKERFHLTLKALISNPLIIACIAGMLYSRTRIPFPVFLVNTFELVSLLTLPMALFSIGGALSTKSVRGNVRLSLVASGFKLILLPLAGFLFMQLFGVDGIAFSVGMIFFALPTSTALYVLSSQLNSDTQLASSAITLSTVLSFGTLSLVLMTV